MIQGLRELWGKIQYNIKRVMDSDPAATNVWMVIWTYPHITALFWHFFAHRLYKAGWPTLARRVALHSRHVTGIEIHPGATIGRGLFIDHGMGGMSSKKVKRHPTIEDEVLIGTGTKILGDITIGARTKIGCNLVIKHDIPKDMVIFETDPENMYVRKPRRTNNGKAEEKKIPDDYIEYYI